VEGSISGVKLSEDSPSVVAPTSHYITKDDWLATATARLGYVSGPWLVYARGGYAATKVTFIGTTPGDYVSVDGTRNGWALGGGVEYMVTRNVSIGVEYSHYDFGTHHYDSLSVGGLPLHADVDFKLDTVMLRANYRFGG
jgi:outer membrane immunogenic protein